MGKVHEKLNGVELNPGSHRIARMSLVALIRNQAVDIPQIDGARIVNFQAEPNPSTQLMEVRTDRLALVFELPAVVNL